MTTIFEALAKIFAIDFYYAASKLLARLLTILGESRIRLFDEQVQNVRRR